MPNNRRDRLAQDFREMLKLQARPYLSWIATKGELPYAQEYLLTIKLRTYVFCSKTNICRNLILRNRYSYITAVSEAFNGSGHNLTSQFFRVTDIAVPIVISIMLSPRQTR